MTTINLPQRIIVGGGAVNRLPSLIKSLGLQRPLLVSDPFLKKTGSVDHIRAIMNADGIDHDVHTDTVEDPTTDSVSDVVGALQSNGNDGLIALGGGSPIDTAKAAGVLAKHGGRMSDYKAPKTFDVEGLKLIAIPTTAGTGSEVTKFAVITDNSTPGASEKMLCVGAGFMPSAAIVDYELTKSMGPRLTADTGIDGLTHAIESYVSRRRNTFSSNLALGAMRLLFLNIRKACEQPADDVARQAMMEGALYAGMAFSNASVCLVHGMSRPLGVHFKVPHGLSNAMLLPAVTNFSISAATGMYADCARSMGLVGPVASTIDHKSDDALAGQLVAALRQLNVDVKVPTLKDFGVDRNAFFSKIPLMAQQALASGSPMHNPRVPSQLEIENLYAEAYDSGT